MTMHARSLFRLATQAFLTFGLAFGSLAGTQAGAQAPASPQPTHEDADLPGDHPGWSVKTYHLMYATQTNEALGIQVALRNMLNASDRVYLNTESNDVLVYASPEQLALAARLIGELDRPKHAYRLTYTLAQSEDGKRVGVQHFTLVALTGQRVQLKQGDKIPVITGSFNNEKAGEETQFTYLDVGMNIDSTVDVFANGLRLRSRIEQSSVASSAPSTGKLADEPIVRQSVLEGTSVLVPGRPLTLGAIDIVGSTRHVDIEVVAEPLT